MEITTLINLCGLLSGGLLSGCAAAAFGRLPRRSLYSRVIRSREEAAAEPRGFVDVFAEGPRVVYLRSRWGLR